MKTITRLIKITIIFGIIFVFGTTAIDYYRMKNGDIPIFNKSEYNSRNKIQKYNGLIYKAQRKIKVSTREPLSESSDIKFKILTLEYDIPSTWQEKKKDYTLDIKKIDSCASSSLYYADNTNKIYTYCLEDIQIVKNQKKEAFNEALKKDDKLLLDILNKVGYLGILPDSSTQLYQNRNDGFTSTDINIYQCNKEFINDIYITPKEVPFQLDFCTYKDDDFKFIFEIVDESEKETATTSTPEVIYEDDIYRYEFDYPKSQFVFITTPAIRGKQETKIALMEALNSGLVTIDDLLSKGLQVNKIDKTNETP